MTLKAQLREEWSKKEVNLKQMKTPSGEVTCAYTAVAHDVLPKEVFPRTSGHAHDDAYLTSYLGIDVPVLFCAMVIMTLPDLYEPVLFCHYFSVAWISSQVATYYYPLHH